MENKSAVTRVAITAPDERATSGSRQPRKNDSSKKGTTVAANNPHAQLVTSRFVPWPGTFPPSASRTPISAAMPRYLRDGKIQPKDRHTGRWYRIFRIAKSEQVKQLVTKIWSPKEGWSNSCCASNRRRIAKQTATFKQQRTMNKIPTSPWPQQTST